MASAIRGIARSSGFNTTSPYTLALNFYGQKLLSVPTDVINKQFMESLLSSSSLKNIRLASEFIQNCRHHQFLPIPLIDLHEISGVLLLFISYA
jgi:hypothetical protein